MFVLVVLHCRKFTWNSVLIKLRLYNAALGESRYIYCVYNRLIARFYPMHTPVSILCSLVCMHHWLTLQSVYVCNTRSALMLLFRVTHEKAEEPKRAFRELQTETLYSKSDTFYWG
jgi:hypothetical protein